MDFQHPGCQNTNNDVTSCTTAAFHSLMDRDVFVFSARWPLARRVRALAVQPAILRHSFEMLAPGCVRRTSINISINHRALFTQCIAISSFTSSRLLGIGVVVAAS